MRPVPSPHSPRRRAALLAAAFVLLAAFAGCGRNRITTVLVPTGIGPAPERPTGSITGYLFFEYPSSGLALNVAPFPPTTAALYLDTVLVRTDTLSQDARNFELTAVPPGSYKILFRSPAFLPESLRSVVVRDGPRDAGNATLILHPADKVQLIGTIPGFEIDQLGLGTAVLDEDPRGHWLYPNSLFPPTEVPAGTWRFKLVTDEAHSTQGNLIGYGGSISDTLVAPLSGARVRFGSGAATDLVVRFPTTGYYEFRLDEWRQTLDITPAPAAARPARRTRS